MSADTTLIPIPGAIDPVPVPRAIRPREDGRVELVGLSKAEIREQLEAAHKSGRLSILLGSNVKQIDADRVLLDCGGAGSALPNDYVFILIGGESPEEFLSKVGIEMVSKALTA